MTLNASGILLPVIDGMSGGRGSGSVDLAVASVNATRNLFGAARDGIHQVMPRVENVSGTQIMPAGTNETLDMVSGVINIASSLLSRTGEAFFITSDSVSLHFDKTTTTWTTFALGWLPVFFHFMPSF